MDPELAALVEAFLRKHPKLENPARAANQCAIATGQLMDELREAGCVAEKIWFRGHRAPVTFDPPGPTGVNAEHAAVLVPAQFASLMIAAGVNAKALSTFIGHASVTITLDRYGHLFPGSEEEAAGLLDAYLERSVGGGPR